MFSKVSKIMNSIKEKIKNIDLIRKTIIIFLIAEISLFLTSYFTQNSILFKTESFLDIFSPIVFTLIMLGYSYYIDSQFHGIIYMALAMLTNLVGYMLYGYNLDNSLALSGFELPLAIFGLIIMLVFSMYKESKQKELIPMKERFKAPRHVKLLYKLMVYCTMFSIFVVVFNNNEFQGLTNIELKTLLILQSVLPTFIMLGYITFTDVAFPVMVFYNLIYLVMGVLVTSYIGVEVMNILYMLEFTVVMGYVSSRYIIYIKNTKNINNGKENNNGSKEQR